MNSDLVFAPTFESTGAVFANYKAFSTKELILSRDAASIYARTPLAYS